MKEVFVREWWDIDFCSKWAFVTDKTNINTWTLTRDFKKAICTKMYYTRKNNVIHNNPYIHALALYDCVKAEKCSRLLEALFRIRIRHLKRFNQHLTQDVIDSAKATVMSSYKQYYLSDCPDNYAFEDQINERMGLTFGSLYQVAIGNLLDL